MLPASQDSQTRSYQTHMRLRGEHYSVGDLIRCGVNRAGDVLAFVKEHDFFYVIVNELTLIEAETPE